MNILIYPHLGFSLYDGGIIALYQLANLLRNAGINVKMDTCCGKHKNHIFDDFLDPKEFNNFIQDAIVIYCEAENTNPLNAKRVVRWMLSSPGRNVNCYAETWGKNDLVYYFNPEPATNEYAPLLTIFNVPSEYRDLKLDRSGTCYAMRKSIRPNYQTAFPPSKTKSIKIEKDWLKVDDEISHNEKQHKYTKIFNNFKFFISYDPMTFTSIIAALCGCISIVNPCENMTKEEWLKKTCYWEYLEKKGLKDINGVAYGMDNVQKATDTICFAYDQINDMIKTYNSEMITSFINDMKKFNDMTNTVENNFFIKEKKQKNRGILLNKISS